MLAQVLKVRLSLKKAYVGTGLKHVLAAKQGFTKALHTLLPVLEDGQVESVTKNIITRQIRLVPALIFQVQMKKRRTDNCVFIFIFFVSFCREITRISCSRSHPVPIPRFQGKKRALNKLNEAFLVPVPLPPLPTICCCLLIDSMLLLFIVVHSDGGVRCPAPSSGKTV